MDEDDTLQTPNKPDAEEEGASHQEVLDEDGGIDPGSGAGQVFDISPDLNISLLKDEPVVPAESARPAEPKRVPFDQPPAAVPAVSGSIIPPSVRPISSSEIDVPSAARPVVFPVARSTAPSTVPSSFPFSSQPPAAPSVVPPAAHSAIRPAFPSQQPPAGPDTPLAAALSDVIHKFTPTAPVPPVTPDMLKNPSKLKPLRTYEGDVAEILAHKGTSAASIAIAERKKIEMEGREGTPGPEEDKKSFRSMLKPILLLASLILLGGGAILGYYLYSQSPFSAPAPAVTEREESTSLVPSDSQTTVKIDGLTAQAILSRIKAEISKTQKPGSIKEISVTRTEGGTSVRVSASEMAGAVGIPVPDIILRTLEPGWMLGVYAGENGGNSAFVAVTTDLFQNAFAGMLSWESTMANDLKPYVGTSTPQGQFKDEIVKNKDVRAFVAGDGSTSFLYSFVDNSTLVVTGSNAALAEVINRLENRAFVR
jgi:hypothetical protein